jgi:hypothetical protein
MKLVVAHIARHNDSGRFAGGLDARVKSRFGTVADDVAISLLRELDCPNGSIDRS